MDNYTINYKVFQSHFKEYIDKVVTKDRLNII